MCGRFKRSLTWAEHGACFEPDSPTPNAPPRYNIAPTDEVYAVRRSAGGAGRELVALRWGLVPYWSKDRKSAARNINARAETIDTKPTFREAFARRPCLVLADGFYEWRKEGAVRQPYLVTLSDGGPFAFAGLWERWRPAPGSEEVLETCAIITTDANRRLREIHPRMPVILQPRDHETWLDREAATARRKLLRPLPEAHLAVVRVGTRVNSVANDDAGCMEPEAPPRRGAGLFD